MGEPRAPERVKLIAGLLTSSADLLRDVHRVLAAEFGAIDAASDPTAWTESSYYAAEMGKTLWRQYVSFTPLIDPESLVRVKHRTNATENWWRVASPRRVNIDPGYLSATKLVLASTKDAAHRIYLGDGIYGEATLRYADGAWQPYPYTYRDYAGPIAGAFFNGVRSRFLTQRRSP
ncbi:MAG TPA: DUF4416 family protein [Candidatus Binatia bacterium]|nr:DUF4416 family protein [Candidatus Binatia bacterium]